MNFGAWKASQLHERIEVTVELATRLHTHFEVVWILGPCMIDDRAYTHTSLNDAVEGMTWANDTHTD